MLAERVLEWTREWKQQGLDEGLKEGLKEGESLMLQRLLTLKFGLLDAATQARLAAADSRNAPGLGRAGADGGECGGGVRGDARAVNGVATFAAA